MTFLLLLLLLGLAAFTGWLWQEVQSLKAQAFLQRLNDRQESTIADIRAQRIKAEEALRRIDGGWLR